MKKLAFILLAFAVFFSSCSSKKSAVYKGSPNRGNTTKNKPGKLRPAVSGNAYVEKLEMSATTTM